MAKIKLRSPLSLAFDLRPIDIAISIFMSLLNKRDLTLLVICICLLLLVAQSELLRNRETFTTRQPISKTGTLPWEGINIKESPDSLDKLPSTTLKDLTDPPAYQHSLFFEEDVDRIPESFVLVHAPGEYWINYDRQI